MDHVKFKNVRFDPDLTPFHKLAEQMAESFGYKSELDIDKKLAQLIRLRVAQRNECAYCIILHSQVAREIGIPLSKIDNISSWWNSELFTEIEKISLSYCDALTIGTPQKFSKIP